MSNLTSSEEKKLTKMLKFGIIINIDEKRVSVDPAEIIRKARKKLK